MQLRGNLENQFCSLADESKYELSTKHYYLFLYTLQ